MNVLGIIPARGGSKSIPRKYLQQLAGQPLIIYMVKAALDTRLIKRIIVSTDDSEIEEVSVSFGAEVIHRPDEIS